MKLFIVLIALILVGITSLIYITDMNKFSEAKAFVSNRAIEAVTLSSNDVTEITDRCRKSFLGPDNPFYLTSNTTISHEGNRIIILVETQDYLRLPILELNSIRISMPIDA